MSRLLTLAPRRVILQSSASSSERTEGVLDQTFLAGVWVMRADQVLPSHRKLLRALPGSACAASFLSSEPEPTGQQTRCLDRPAQRRLMNPPGFSGSRLSPPDHQLPRGG